MIPQLLLLLLYSTEYNNIIHSSLWREKELTQLCADDQLGVPHSHVYTTLR